MLNPILLYIEKESEKRKTRLAELENKLSNPEILNNKSLYQSCAKEASQLRQFLEKYNALRNIFKTLEETTQLVESKNADIELKELAQEELIRLNNDKEIILNDIEDSLIGDSTDYNQNIIVEIRAGTGGLEASLFAADLFRMYSKYAAKKNWKLERISANITEKGGFKEIVFSVSGEGVYKKLKYESGTHRVQRVPLTEASGRIHTSASTVAILLEPEDVDIKIDPKDLQVDVFRSGGSGGQHVNVTDSAVRITHIPTGLIVSCQDERSQYKNKEKAMRVLRARLLDAIQAKQQKELSAARKLQVGSGDRSEKIRTYNFPEKRITDHRINLALYRLDEVLDGDLDELVDSLYMEEKKRKVKALLED